MKQYKIIGSETVDDAIFRRFGYICTDPYRSDVEEEERLEILEYLNSKNWQLPPLEEFVVKRIK